MSNQFQSKDKSVNSSRIKDLFQQDLDNVRLRQDMGPEEPETKRDEPEPFNFAKNPTSQIRSPENEDFAFYDEQQ